MYECGIFITYHKMAKPTYVNLSFKFNKSGAPIMLNNRPFCAYILNIHLVPPSESSFIVSNVSNSLGSMVNESKILLRNFANELSCNHFQCLNSQNKLSLKRKNYSVTLTDWKGKLTHLNSFEENSGWKVVKKGK